jgi:hypothetical protein
MLEEVAPLDHKYVFPALEVKVTLPPSQNVVGPPAEIVGCAGKEFTVTLTDALKVVNPSKTATLYVVEVTGFTVGLARVDVNPEGTEVHV